jgi:transposase
LKYKELTFQDLARRHDDKSKGRGNKKNGNKYLSWAFSEAAEFASRYDDKARAFYNRKLKKSNFMVAHMALAHKLARAAYYIMRDHVPYMPDKLFT